MTPSPMDAIWSRIDAIGAWLIVASVQVALLCVVVAIVDRVLAGRVWPQIRASLWWMVLLALVVPPLFDSPISLWRHVDPAADLHEIVRPLPVKSPDELRIEDMFERGPTQQVVASHTDYRFITRGVVCIWLSGCLIFSIVTLVRMSRERRRWLGSGSLSLPDWLASVIQQAADRVLLKQLPTVRIHEDARGAAVIGCWRPVVVLPVSFLNCASREQVIHVLVHELAHVRRRDAIASLVCAMIQLVYWFHPAAWIARSRLETLREICCDQAAIAALNDSTGGYRRTLLQLAQSLLVLHSTPAPLAFVHQHSQIMARLMHLQRPLPGRPRAVRAVATTVLAMLLLCCIPRLSPTSRPTESAAVMKWEELPGCFQLRYAVMREMAERSAREKSE